MKKQQWEKPKMEKETVKSVLSVGKGACTPTSPQPSGTSCGDCDGSNSRCSAGSNDINRGG